MGHTTFYYQCNALIVICGGSQLGSSTKFIFLMVTLHVINIPLSNGQLHLENFAMFHLDTISICVTYSSTLLVPFEKLLPSLQLRAIFNPPTQVLTTPSPPKNLSLFIF